MNEHLDLDIPLGTNTAVSAVKAIQISHQQGIPIHHITSNNINSILPILQVGSDVKTDIQNSVNAGYNVTIPEREITYAKWQGVGYIIQDPTTGAGACLITGGAAGAQMLIGIGIWLAAEKEFVDGQALIVKGNLEGIPETISEQAIYLAMGATFCLGYNPIYKIIYSNDDLLNEIGKPNYEIFYFRGHGTSTPSSTPIPKRGNYKFVFSSACIGLPILTPSCDSFLGYEGKTNPLAANVFEEAFWVWTCHGKTIGESVDWGKRRLFYYFWPIPMCSPKCTHGEEIILKKYGG